MRMEGREANSQLHPPKSLLYSIVEKNEILLS